MAVASGTLLLATSTVLLAVFTGRSLALGRAELAVAEGSLKAVQEQGQKLAEQVAATQSQAAAIQGQVAATQSQVAATQEQAAIGRQTLEASWRPLLVDVPWGYRNRSMALGGVGDAAEVDVTTTQQGHIALDVPVRNIGSGPAVITRVGLSVTQLHDEATSLSSGIVAAGEVLRLGFEVKADSATLKALNAALAARHPFVVTVFYGDQSGLGKWRTRIYFHKPTKANVYDVEHVEVYVGDENTPFASTRPQS
jgi:hypothetical protein